MQITIKCLLLFLFPFLCFGQRSKNLELWGGIRFQHGYYSRYWPSTKISRQIGYEFEALYPVASITNRIVANVSLGYTRSAYERIQPGLVNYSNILFPTGIGMWSSTDYENYTTRAIELGHSYRVAINHALFLEAGLSLQKSLSNDYRLRQYIAPEALLIDTTITIKKSLFDKTTIFPGLRVAFIAKHRNFNLRIQYRYYYRSLDQIGVYYQNTTRQTTTDAFSIALGYTFKKRTSARGYYQTNL